MKKNVKSLRLKYGKKSSESGSHILKESTKDEIVTPDKTPQKPIIKPKQVERSLPKPWNQALSKPIVQVSGSGLVQNKQDLSSEHSSSFEVPHENQRSIPKPVSIEEQKEQKQKDHVNESIGNPDSSEDIIPWLGRLSESPVDVAELADGSLMWYGLIDEQLSEYDYDKKEVDYSKELKKLEEKIE